MGRPDQRITPALPSSAFKTYQILAPSDRMELAACEKVGCEAWRYGWETRLDEATATGQHLAGLVRGLRDRTFKEMRDGAITVFRFGPGQKCFREHHTRPETYRVLGGDWRANQGVIRAHTRPADWVEDFSEHQQRIADQADRG